ncbi:cytochrome P450 [Actinomadura sp. LD22]|uniref:Cytochrome P450 n=1 Tax=Actinomadura physcomitrii TaxID=2650748 RepID=A0A6I4MAX6_9ACTN|nr:cytochrome P450 [Actinomadura physcomitrii]MWA02932.1 cytochrome P450 [Actinomadura physcomitrii]
MPPTVSVNFYAPEVIADPWPHFAQIREAGPVVYNEALSVWHVHRHADVTRCLTDTGHLSSTVMKESAPWIADSMIANDPPDHHRLRNPLQSAFTKRGLARWEPRVTALIDDLFARFAAKVAGGGRVDLVDDFIWHIPSVVIAEMMGVPPEKRAAFHAWSEDIVTGVGGGTTDVSDLGRQKLARAQEASRLIREFLAEEIARRRSRPADDLLGQAVAANDGGAMTDDELIQTAVLLLIAGNDTTAKLLAQCAVKLFQFPGQRDLLVEDPGLIPAAIEEVLRLEQLSLSVPRSVVNGPITIAGQVIPDGASVWLMTGTANRDPDVFPDADVLDVRRSRSAAHFGFGHGAHLCLGANLARMEVRIGLERILSRYPRYDVRGFEFSESWSVRGPVRIDFAPEPTAVMV